jgi:hypothetical protein
MLLALSLAAGPAMAQTPKKKAPKVEAKNKAEPKSEPPPQPPPKKKKRVIEEEEIEDGEAPPKKEEAAKEGWAEARTHYGVGLLVGPALSTNNASGSVALLPHGSLAFVLDHRLGASAYVRFEPTVGLLRRRSTVNVVREVDTTRQPPLIRTEDIVSTVTSLDASLRLLLGYDYAASWTGRVGVLGGLNTASTASTSARGEAVCTDDNRSTGLLYGAHLTPVAYRGVSGRRAFEIGISAELRSQTIPRCDVPFKNDFVVNEGERALFRPKKVDTPFTVVAVGLQGVFFF